MVILQRQKKQLRDCGENNSIIPQNKTELLPDSTAKTKSNRRPQLERVTVENTLEKRPIYKSYEDLTSSDDFYYDDVKTLYQQTEIFPNSQEEYEEKRTHQKIESPKLIGARLFLLFAYIIAGASLFVSIFYLVATYMATRR